MSKEQKQIHDLHLSTIMKMWLVVIPIIVGVIGTGTALALWLTLSEEPVAEQVTYHINPVDRYMLDNIHNNFRHTYLQYLQARVNFNSSSDQVEKLERRLNSLIQEEEKIILKYDPDYATSWPSSVGVLSEIVNQLPGPVFYTIFLGVGILCFMIARSIAFFVIIRPYTSDSDSGYVREA